MLTIFALHLFDCLMREFIGFILLLGVIACQPKEEKTLSGLDRLLKDYELQPSVQSANIYLDSLSSFLGTQSEPGELQQSYLEKGMEVSLAQGLLSKAPGYLLPLIKD